jgi:hypothetical protein
MAVDPMSERCGPKLDWVRHHLRTAAALGARPTRHGQTRLARVADGDGRCLAWWKAAATLDGAQREAAALRAIASVDPGAVPELLAHDASRGWLLLGHVEGTLWSEVLGGGARGEPNAAPRACATRLGRWRRVLDAIEAPPDPLPLDVAIAARREGWIKRGRGLVDPVILAELTARIEPTRFVGEARGLCHRDLDPHNVIWAGLHVHRDLARGDAVPVVIDFGQSRADHPLVDAVRLHVTAFDGDREHLAAFIDGWRGHGLAGEEQARFDTLLALEILGTLVWAALHDDPAFHARAIRAWHRSTRG